MEMDISESASWLGIREGVRNYDIEINSLLIFTRIDSNIELKMLPLADQTGMVNQRRSQVFTTEKWYRVGWKSILSSHGVANLENEAQQNAAKKEHTRNKAPQQKPANESRKAHELMYPDNMHEP